MLVSYCLTIASVLQGESTRSSSFKAVLYLITAVYAVAYCGMIVSTVIATKSNPTDPTVDFERLVRIQKQPNLEKISVIQEVAEFYCNICQTHVVEGSKHCQFCDRCVYEFDHHCKWIGNDIGRLNYIIFLRMLMFVMATLLVQAIYCVILLTTPDLSKGSFLA